MRGYTELVAKVQEAMQKLQQDATDRNRACVPADQEQKKRTREICALMEALCIIDISEKLAYQGVSGIDTLAKIEFSDDELIQLGLTKIVHRVTFKEWQKQKDLAKKAEELEAEKKPPASPSPQQHLLQLPEGDGESNANAAPRTSANNFDAVRQIKQEWPDLLTSAARVKAQPLPLTVSIADAQRLLVDYGIDEVTSAPRVRLLIDHFVVEFR